MKKRKLPTLLLVFLITFTLHAQEDMSKSRKIAIAIHGGAGTIKKKNMTDEMEKDYIAALEKALNIGYKVLEEGGASIDAVEATIRYMEDSPLFNAGKGAVYNSEGEHEMDASIMDGSTLNAGSVGGVKHIKNPITAARKVMDESPHVMLMGDGADEFARQQGLEMVKPQYFDTEKRFKQWQKVKAKEEKLENPANDKGLNIDKLENNKLGTVGVAALDKNGNLAAGTSTGGMTNKRYGRIGDSPIIGAGTYANNKTCAISSTGHGEYFIRRLVAYDIAALMEYKGMSIQEAAGKVIHEKLKELGGKGGVIGVDKDGNITMTFNTQGMYRGYISKEGKMVVEIYAQVE
ncbi:MAG: isoaspartyl peptidase/L-asparaginase [Bacteroidetes bacterium]|nr:isoaspartyl peptidase/L-asparaginase [Bacteroidota bacterium]